MGSPTGGSEVGLLLESLRAGPSKDDVAGEAQAVLSIAALIRSHPVAAGSTLSAVRASGRNPPRSWTEKFVASVIAVALATSTGLVVVGSFPHSARRSAAGVETSTGIQRGVGTPEPADQGPSSRSVRSRPSSERPRLPGTAEPTPAKKTKAQGADASSPGQPGGSIPGTRSGTGSGSGTRSGTSGSGSGSGTGSDQAAGHSLGGDRGQGKDRGSGNDDRLVGGGGHRKNDSRPSRSGGHHS